MSVKIARISLLIAAVILAIAPLFPDLSPSHVFNEDWPPHARFHMVWLLGLMTSLGLVTMVGAVMVHSRKLFLMRLITLPGWIVLASFLLASLTVKSYGGSVAAHVEEPMIMGLNGNSFGFLIATVFQAIATVIIWNRGL